MSAHRAPDPADLPGPSPARVAWLIPGVLMVIGGQIWLLARAPAGGFADGLLAGGAGRVAWIALQVWALCAVLVLLWRLCLVARYRPTPSVADEALPSITVIVPAYNEGRQVYETLRSLVESDYPRDRLHVVAVDDGSGDDTWQWIARGRADFGDMVTAVRCARNRGKRAALYEGFARARGEVLVTVDSDSEVRRDTLRNLVSPFVLDPRVGAVAGNVRVLNESGVIARMLDVSFTCAFEFMRASESMVDTVMCCPGALSAYRRSLVESFKDQWLAQTFLGRPANIGEDRAMTNLVLRRGYLVRFQSNAVVLTEVPRRLPQLCRMLLRWARSNVRETLVLARFVFTRFRPGPKLGARINLTWAATLLLIRAAIFVPSLVYLVVRPEMLGWGAGAIALGAVLPAAVYAASRRSPRALWAVPYAWFSAICLSWIAPYALLTPQRSAWLTRRLPTAGPGTGAAVAGLRPRRTPRAAPRRARQVSRVQVDELA